MSVLMSVGVKPVLPADSAVSTDVSRYDASRVESPLCVVTTAHGATTTKANIPYFGQNRQESEFWQEQPDFGFLTSRAKILNFC